MLPEETSCIQEQTLHLLAGWLNSRAKFYPQAELPTASARGRQTYLKAKPRLQHVIEIRHFKLEWVLTHGTFPTLPVPGSSADAFPCPRSRAVQHNTAIAGQEGKVLSTLLYSLCSLAFERTIATQVIWHAYKWQICFRGNKLAISRLYFPSWTNCQRL